MMKVDFLLPLSRGMFAKIDVGDAERAGTYKWSASAPEPGRYYAHTKMPNGEHVYLHRFLIDAPDNVMVDHRNRDTLDCRRINLRTATAGQNSINAMRVNKTGFRGVDLRHGRYRAKIKYMGVIRHIGTYDSPEMAARAYDFLATSLHGEFAVLNFPRAAQ